MRAGVGSPIEPTARAELEESTQTNGRPAVAAHPDVREPPSSPDPLSMLSNELEQLDRPMRVALPDETGSSADTAWPPTPRRPRRRRVQVTSTVVLALVCAGAAVVSIRAFVAASPEGFPGVLQPAQAISLNFSELGYLSSLRAHPGDRVRAGEILARLNPVGAHALALEAQAATAAVAADQQDLVVAEQAVIGPPAVRLAGVRRAKAQLAADQARVAQPRAILDQAAIRSPVNGLVVNVSGAMGELVGPNGVQIDGTDQPQPVTQAPSLSLFSPASRQTVVANRNTTSPLIQVAAGPTEMQAQVPESAVGGMRYGRAATVTVPALRASFRARLLRVVPDPAQTSGDVSYEVVFVLQHPSPQALPGMSANVTLGR